MFSARAGVFLPEPEFFLPEPEVKNPEFAQHYLVLIGSKVISELILSLTLLLYLQNASGSQEILYGIKFNVQLCLKVVVQTIKYKQAL